MSDNNKTRKCPPYHLKNASTGKCEVYKVYQLRTKPGSDNIKLMPQALRDMIPDDVYENEYIKNKKNFKIEIIKGNKTRKEHKVQKSKSSENSPKIVKNKQNITIHSTESPKTDIDKYLDYLYPRRDDETNDDFNIKIASHKEFKHSQYDGTIHDIKMKSDEICNSDFELLPHQNFVKNFISFNTPYNSLLLYHGLGSGKTCSAIGVAEEMRQYMKQTGITKSIYVIASPNVQDNFKSQLFDESKLENNNGLWSINNCTGTALLHEINPSGIKNMKKERVITQVNALINQYYNFMGYTQFGHFTERVTDVSKIDVKKRAQIKKQKINRFFENKLIIIDEVHNIRITDDNKLKKIAEMLMEICKYTNNLRLLLLSATPMFDSYEEIIWLTNLLNANDKKSLIKTSDVFTNKGEFTEKNEENGRDLLQRKLTGYVSYVRSENPYTFPLRIYAKNDVWNHPIHFKNPKYQMNDEIIKSPMQHLQNFLYYNTIGQYQKKVYDLFVRTFYDEDLKELNEGTSKSFSILQKPLLTLNMTYPHSDYDLNDSSKLSEKTLSSMIGEAGFERVMKSVNKQYEYKKDIVEKYGKIFKQGELHKYSAKIDQICKIIKKSQGIIIIYSQYIEGGIVPMALALEEMGFTRYCSDESVKPLLRTPGEPIDSSSMSTNEELQYELDNAKQLYDNAKQELEDMKEQCENGSEDEENCDAIIEELTQQMKEQYDNYKDIKNSFTQAKYTIISGDKKYSPNNDADIKYINRAENRYGKHVKVYLISKAAAEGVDFKNIRQIHVLEPWYNMNRIEQIIGRGVRNLGHCALPFEKRNVEIFLHGTTLDGEHEATDMYVYRLAEKKAIKIGKVTRLLKETSIDCLLNIGQTNFTAPEISKIAANKNIKCILSNGNKQNVLYGDKPYTEMCDYMENCNYTCSSLISNLESIETTNTTLSDSFITFNNDKIMQRIRNLFKDMPSGKHFYTKKELFKSINLSKKYTDEQIYSSLQTLIDNENQYISDKYGRIGHLTNKGEHYLFQPNEITDDKSSLYERSVPIDIKIPNIEIAIPLSEKTESKKIDITETLKELKTNYDIAFSTNVVRSGDTNWFKNFSTIVTHMESQYGIKHEALQKYVVHHMIDELDFHIKLQLIENLYTTENLNNIAQIVKKYFDNMLMISSDKKLQAIVLAKDNTDKSIFVFRDNKWVQAEYTDLTKLQNVESVKSYPTNSVFGFISYIDEGFAFKIRDINEKRNTKGARMSQASANTVVRICNRVIGEQNYSMENITENEKGKSMIKFVKDNSLYSKNKLVVVLETLLRHYDDIHKNNKSWILTNEKMLANNK